MQRFQGGTKLRVMRNGKRAVVPGAQARGWSPEGTCSQGPVIGPGGHG